MALLLCVALLAAAGGVMAQNCDDNYDCITPAFHVNGGSYQFDFSSLCKESGPDYVFNDDVVSDSLSVCLRHSRSRTS